MATISDILEDRVRPDDDPWAPGRDRAELLRRFREQLKPIPGIAQALSRLGAPHCVASSSQPERIRLSLEITGLLELFEPHIYSATMVARGKPFPDLFLHAAKDMGADPRRCLVIEDSPAGVMAADDAGMRVFAFTGGSHAGEGSLRAAIDGLAPDRVFSDMRSLQRLMRRDESPLMAGLVCGVDVGTGSARAGIFDRHGVLLGRAEHPIALYREQGDRGEHDSPMRSGWPSAPPFAARTCGIRRDPADVAGSSFDATCSLVVRGSGRAAACPRTGDPPLRHHRLVRPSRHRRGRGMHAPPATACSTISAASCRPRCSCPS